MAQVTKLPVAAAGRKKKAHVSVDDETTRSAQTHPSPVADLTTVSNAPKDAPQTLEKALGLQVRTLRRQRDLSASELGQAANISLGMVSKIENGQSSPSLSTMNSLAKALDVPLSSLFSTLEEKRDCSYVRGRERRHHRATRNQSRPHLRINRSLAGWRSRRRALPDYSGGRCRALPGIPSLRHRAHLHADRRSHLQALQSRLPSQARRLTDVRFVRFARPCAASSHPVDLCRRDHLSSSISLKDRLRYRSSRLRLMNMAAQPLLQRTTSSNVRFRTALTSFARYLEYGAGWLPFTSFMYVRQASSA